MNVSGTSPGPGRVSPRTAGRSPQPALRATAGAVVERATDAPSAHSEKQPVWAPTNTRRATTAASPGSVRRPMGSHHHLPVPVAILTLLSAAPTGATLVWHGNPAAVFTSKLLSRPKRPTLTSNDSYRIRATWPPLSSSASSTSGTATRRNLPPKSKKFPLDTGRTRGDEQAFLADFRNRCSTGERGHGLLLPRPRGRRSLIPRAFDSVGDDCHLCPTAVNVDHTAVDECRLVARQIDSRICDFVWSTAPARWCAMHREFSQAASTIRSVRIRGPDHAGRDGIDPPHSRPVRTPRPKPSSRISIRAFR